MFHGAYFSNYTAWLMNPLQIKPSAQSVWPVVGQEILNADVGENSKVFKLLQVLPNLAARCNNSTTTFVSF
jgi:photosystem I P700 chlorophyll a apoprotein A1